jgi:TolB-like protein/Tfp pilus assembly protein PilF
MFTDIVGYTALMGQDEEKAFVLLKKNREIQKPLIQQYNGHWIKELGDGVLASFPTATDAVLCAGSILQSGKKIPDLKLRIGIHIGDIVFENDDVFGNGVNIAARLLTQAAVGGICISEAVHNNVSSKKGITTTFLREEILKNVKEPVRIYEVNIDASLFPEVSSKTEQSAHTVTNHEPAGKAKEKSIAVLPFVNMSADPEQEYFSDGISEDIINTLVRVPNLKVTGRTSSFHFKGKNIDMREIGQTLNVQTLLEGSVRSAGNRIRITAQLIDVNSGFHLWSEKYDRVLDNVFEVQDEIARTIVEKLQITLSGNPAQSIGREQTQSVEAYQHYLRGRSLLYKRGKFLKNALQEFQKALESDPEYALAYSGLADTYTTLCYYGVLNPEIAWPKSKEYAGLARKYGPEMAETYNCNAGIALFYDWDWQAAEKQYLKALAINPGYEQAAAWYGCHYLTLIAGKHDEGIQVLRTALETNSLSPYLNSVLCVVLGAHGQFNEALEKGRLAIELDQGSYAANFYLAQTLYWAGFYEDVEKGLEISVTMSNRHQWSVTYLAMVYYDLNKKEKAAELYEELKMRSSTEYIQPSVLASVAAHLGYDDDALKYAQRAMDIKDPLLVLVSNSNPFGKKLLALAGFDEISGKMKQPG